MDAITIIKNDHRIVENLFKQFENLDGRSPEQKQQIVTQLVKELSVHSAIEEQVLYPAVRDAIPAENDEVLQALEEHHVVKWELDEIEDMKPTDERYDAKVNVLIQNVRHHVEEEESEILPMLADQLTPAQLDQIGDKLQQAKKVAPTHPHPRAPDTPPGNIVAGAGAAMVDRTKDAAKGAVKGAAERVKGAAEQLKGKKHKR
ncbi:MAG TPA: hemerythrin domain-containing protein [Polyangia bacterium]|jgi:hemerythrin-like domain-containing protein